MIGWPTGEGGAPGDGGAPGVGGTTPRGAKPASADPGELPPSPIDARTLRRWRRYLADERAEASVYRHLADRRRGEEQQILLELADAEGRHAAHWEQLLGEHTPANSRARGRVKAGFRTRLLVLLARRLGSVFVLALAERAEGRSPYAADAHATETMAADERIHGEVVRGLAARGRLRLSGSFRAAVFGANDGLVSNLALVLGIGAAGASATVVLFTGLAGLLAGALSMGAGEYVSVRSQRELLQASIPDPRAAGVLPHLDVDANELALVYRARGMSIEQAQAHARSVLAGLRSWHDPAIAESYGPEDGEATPQAVEPVDAHEALGTGWRAAVASFCFFASGAIIPVLPYALGAAGITAQIIAAVLVGAALLITGAIVGLLSGASPLARALRQLAIGYGAAAATYALGLAFGV